jgi:hypothetical protein
LTKIAEAAGKKMRKLRNNLSIKKSDITRSLSRIAKNPHAPMSAASTSSASAVRRAPSFSTVRNVVRSTPAQDTTTFYITLNIEDVNSQNDAEKNNDGKCE